MCYLTSWHAAMQEVVLGVVSCLIVYSGHYS